LVTEFFWPAFSEEGWHRLIGAWAFIDPWWQNAPGRLGRRDVQYLSTEARETSKRILQHLGFVGAAKEVTWVLNPS